MTTQAELFAPCPYPNPPEPPEPPPILQALLTASETFADDPPDTPNSVNPPKSTNARALVAQVIEAEQDFEFYPTTNEIISALCRDIPKVEGDRYSHKEFSSILDIGAGNGKVLLAVRDHFRNQADKWGNRRVCFEALHAIEKSTLLCQQLPEDVLIVGTEFEEQSLLSKRVDVTFSNPPYSQFERWAEKIIRQSASRLVYLVIPTRWERSQVIADALKFRDAKAKQVGSFDFENAEDRTARAQVHLLRIELQTGNNGDDAFERFFEEQFADLIAKFKKPAAPVGSDEDPDRESEDVQAGRARSEREKQFGKLVVGPNYPEALVNLYRLEMANVERNYKLVSELDADLLREFEIVPTRIMACLKTRLDGLRNTYWHELFNRLSTITDRLTTQSRQRLLDVLHKHVHVDFTVSNICAVLIWVIKNANRYIDSQLIDVYDIMVAKCNVKMYKSNQRTFGDDRWRYNNGEEPTRFALDYRIVTHRVGGFNGGEYSWNKGLDESGRNFLCDLLTIAKNLGFNCDTNQNSLIRGGEGWTAGGLQTFYFRTKTGQRLPLYDVRAFKNRNMHLRLNKDFILALNVEHGRLKGWLRSGEEAAQELQEPQAAQFFKTNTQLANGEPLLMLS